MQLNKKLLTMAFLVVVVCLCSITLVSAIAADADSKGLYREIGAFSSWYDNENADVCYPDLIKDKVNGYDKLVNRNVDEIQDMRELIGVEKIRLKTESSYQFVESPLVVIDGSNDDNVVDNIVTDNDDIFLKIYTTNSKFKVTSTSSITNDDVDSDNSIYKVDAIRKCSSDKDQGTRFVIKLDSIKERLNCGVIQQIGYSSLPAVVNKNIGDLVTFDKKEVIVEEVVDDVQIHPTAAIAIDTSSNSDGVDVYFSTSVVAPTIKYNSFLSTLGTVKWIDSALTSLHNRL